MSTNHGDQESLNTFTLPNTVENSLNNSYEATWEHRTTIVAQPSPPTNYSVNTNAWKPKNNNDPIQFTVENEVHNVTKPRKACQVKKLDIPNVINPWSLLQSPLMKGQLSHSRYGNPSCRELDKLRETQSGSEEIILPLPTFPMMEIQNSQFAGYMADLSAHQANSAHHKQKDARRIHHARIPRRFESLQTKSTTWSLTMKVNAER